MGHMYKLQSWFPHPEMGGAGFNIILNKKWKEAASQPDHRPIKKGTKKGCFDSSPII